ncbi:helix-turn-helix transcriptional regulator [Streptomyces sp. NPDC087437]|uniref:helix-turn-helix transcriptional regulator n=1 Tax=Streptomyces sp. NPDC087437 TaxID=3365789 RepID=UPI0038241676
MSYQSIAAVAVGAESGATVSVGWLHLIFTPAAVATFIRNHIDRPTTDLEPRRLYTAREIETLTGLTAATIRADRSRGRCPVPDDTEGRAHRWYGATVTEALAARRGYRKPSADGARER